MSITPAKAILVDRRNFSTLKDQILAELAPAEIVGIDLETDNRNAHDGIKAYGDDGVFDLRRQIITGLSLYVDGSANAYYFNLMHADEENRLKWSEVEPILNAKPEKALWIAHNAPFEITMLKAVYGYELTNYICTLQMAVSAYNQDEYNKHSLFTKGLGGITKVLGTAAVEFSNYGGRANMTSSQFEVFNQVVSKSSRAEHSYNGLVKSIAYGYGLKQAVKSHFGYRMTEYKDVVGKGSMMDVTGDHVVAYGCDDAFWCVKLFHHLKEFMLETNPQVLKTFLTQELPMIEVYSDVWRTGMRVNYPAVKSRRELEREDYAKKLVRLKELIKKKLPFDSAPHSGLLADDSKYPGLYEKYRARITEWAGESDTGKSATDIIVAVSGAVSDALCTELGKTKGQLNFSYYMTQRVIMYDLLRQKCIKYKGAVQSDGEARGKLLERLKDDDKEIVQILNQMTDIEQRMKLYLNPYLQLADPETERVYPQLSSQLNTRRLAASWPNPMQLAKRGESTYVRGFYLPDEDDHVIVSLDWSSFELVILGELSGDPGFKDAFGQLPFKDLHSAATVNCLQVTIPEMTLELFKKLDTLTTDEVNKINPKILIDPSGKPMEPKKAKKFWRTEVGKGANFNYAYSGALSTVGEKLGWTKEEMWAATEKYRETFPVMEQWRVDTIHRLQRDGFLTLPDGHRRVRFEATPEWGQFMQNQFTQREKLLGLDHNGLSTFGKEVVRSIQTRAGNQGVNAMIQGTNATCAKRSIIRILAGIKEQSLRARFMIPIHDEVVFSVHREDVVPFIHLAKEVMTNHPDIFKTLKLDCTASVGRTFEPYDSVKAPTGQIECDECQEDFFGGEIKRGSKLNDDEINRIVTEHLFAND